MTTVSVACLAGSGAAAKTASIDTPFALTVLQGGDTPADGPLFDAPDETADGPLFTVAGGHFRIVAPVTDTRNNGGIGPIPEPASWLTMLIGFAFAGIALRRRRRQPAQA